MPREHSGCRVIRCRTKRDGWLSHTLMLWRRDGEPGEMQAMLPGLKHCQMEGGYESHEAPG